MDTITLVVPCYNEEDALPLFYKEAEIISSEMSGQEFEFLFIDDGSTDDTLRILNELKKKDKRIRYISFSRNFGKEAGLYAGLKNSTGDYVAVMDVDLQDPPELLKEMYHTLKKEAYDCVATRRESRKGEPPIRSFFAWTFYKLINKVSKTEIVDGARDFRMMNRTMVNAIMEITEYNRFSKGIFGWVGFRTKWLSYQNVERVAGKTKWKFWGLLVYALDGISAFSTVPLVLSSVFGILFFFISFFMIAVMVFKTLIFGEPVPGYPSLVCTIFLIAGIQLFCMGIMGSYMSKIYLETKKRPIYIVKCTEKSGEEVDDSKNPPIS